MTEVRAHRERRVAVWLMAAYVVVSLCFAATVFLTTLSIAGCDLSCDFGLQTWTVNSFLILDMLLAVAMATVFIHRQRRGLTAWWVPTSGIGLIAIAALVALLLSRVALGN